MRILIVFAILFILFPHESKAQSFCSNLIYSEISVFAECISRYINDPFNRMNHRQREKALLLDQNRRDTYFCKFDIIDFFICKLNGKKIDTTHFFWMMANEYKKTPYSVNKKMSKWEWYCRIAPKQVYDKTHKCKYHIFPHSEQK